MENLQSCICCGSTDIRKESDIKDYYVTQESFSLNKCNHCGFLFTNPRPDIEEIKKYYESVQYISHHSNDNSLFHKVYRTIRNIMTKKKLSIIENQLNKNKSEIKLLDYGAASGDFLAACRQNNMTNLFGIEQDETCRIIAQQNHGFELQAPSALATMEAESLDAITLWHVLEHVHNIEETISNFERVLTKNGTLLVSVPNIASYDAEFYKEYWSALDVPRHLYHFEPKTIELLFNRLGFKLVATYPMPFDAYYIALHSEWYLKTNSLFALLKATWIGFVSNWKAKKSNNYSSLIYVFKK